MKRITISEYTEEEFRNLIEEVLQTATTKRKGFQEEVLSKKETAEFFKVTLATITNWVNNGWLKPAMMGGKPFFLKSELLQTLKNNR